MRPADTGSPEPEHGFSTDVAGSEHLAIVIVDDDDRFAELLVMCLGAEPDLHVECRASSVLEAEAAARRVAVDVVVTDYRLPDGTGAALARRLHLFDPRLAVVVMTADYGMWVVEDATRAGARAVLDKVVGPSGIARVIREAALDPRS